MILDLALALALLALAAGVALWWASERRRRALGLPRRRAIYQDRTEGHEPVLQARTLHVQTASGQSSMLDGFQVVDATRLAALKGKPLQALHASGDLAVIHAHLSSLQNVQRLSARLDRRLPASNTIN